jgi:hypothetical protein
MRSVALASLVILCALGLAQAQPPQTFPPEVKKTVDAFRGNWTGESTMTMPGKAPEVVKVTATCRAVVHAMGAMCELKSLGKSSMPVDQTCLVGYDIEGTGVHLMCVTAMGEVNDHRGSWSGDTTITYEPYKGMMHGKPVTENMTMEWPTPTTFVNRGSTMMADGQTYSFELSLRRK